MVGLNSNDQHGLVVLDGLDEYPLTAELAASNAQPNSGRKVVTEWLQTFYKRHANAHVLITSHDETNIRKCFGGSAQLDVGKGITGDVDLFLHSCIDRITEGDDGWKNEFRLQMFDKMRGGNERRFRWVTLVEQRLLSCLDNQMMEDALRTLPQTLEGLYADLLRQIPRDYKAKVRLILIWLAYSLRPLSLRELASAVSIRNPQKVLEICNSSLVSLQWNPYWDYKRDEPHDIVNDLVSFDHFSVKEYLTSGHLLASEEMAFFHATPLVAHLTIAEVSVSHLISTNGIDLFTERRNDSGSSFYGTDWPEFPLLDYSTRWFEHIQQADALDKKLEPDGSRSEARPTAKESEPDFLRTQTHALFCEGFSQSLQNWYYLLRRKYGPANGIWRCRDSMSPMFIASLLDLPDNVRRLINNGANIDGNGVSRSITKDLYITKPIQAAAINGNLEILNFLLEKNANLTQSELDLVVRGSRRHGAAVLSTILEARPGLAITDNTAIPTTEGRSLEMLSYILDNYDLMSPTLLETIINKCFYVGCHDDLLEQVMNRGETIGCDRNRMLELLIRRSTCTHVRIVVDRYKPPKAMGQTILHWVFENEMTSYQMLPVVLEYYRDLGVEFEITEMMLVKAAIFDAVATGLFEVILGYAKRIVITVKVMKNISNNGLRHVLMTLLLNDGTSGVRYCDKVWEWEHLASFRGEKQTPASESADKMMKAAARGVPEAFAYLRAHARRNVTFARTLAEAEASNADA